MAADHNTNQCLQKHWACLVLEKAIYIYMPVSIQRLEKHWACLVLEKTMHLLVFGKGLAVFQQVVLEKATCRQQAFVQFWFLKLYSFEGQVTNTSLCFTKVDSSSF